MTKVLLVLVKNDTIVFVGKEFRAILDQHLRAFELNEMTETAAQFPTDLVDPIPLDAYSIENKQFVVMKHFWQAQEL